LNYKRVEQKIIQLVETHSAQKILQDVVDVLYQTFQKYNWIGIYILKEKNLVLSAWNGKHATKHKKIPLGVGICGAAAKTGKTEIVDDVLQDKRYLSCFYSTRSEIVIPIKKKNVIIGEIDVDSNTNAAFDKHDVILLEKVADMLSEHI
jgi:L-methionine (R)-S-oxide reductase